MEEVQKNIIDRILRMCEKYPNESNKTRKESVQNFELSSLCLEVKHNRMPGSAIRETDKPFEQQNR